MKEKKNTQMTKGMMGLYLLLTLVGGVAIVVCMINTQWVHGDEWRARAAKREVGQRTETARRGNIYSSDGKILATTVTVCDFYLDLSNSPLLDRKGNPLMDKKGNPRQKGPIVDSCFDKYLDTVCMILANAVPSHNAQYYRNRIADERAKSRPRQCFLVERRLPYSAWMAIRRLPGWKGGVVRQVDGRSVVRQVRAHIYGNMAENTIGFDNGRERGTYTGLEGAYDSLLRGRDGIYNCRRLTRGIWLPDEPGEHTEVARRTDNDRVDTIILQRKIDGQSIVATIDTRYQDIAESALRRALHQYGGTAGCAILMEVETGYVLACANLEVDTGVHEFREVRDRNVAVSDVYQPGSTFKSVVLTAMMNDPDLKLDTAMRFRVGSKNYAGGREDGQVDDDHDVKDREGRVRDTLNVREIIEQSSNVGMVEMGWHLYRMAYRSDTLRQLMLKIFPYEKLNPDVVAPQSRSYILKDMKPVANFTRLCYGYSTRVTPLQLATFYNALAAGGRMVKPLFCRAVIDNKGNRTEIKPVVMNPHAFDSKKAAVLRSMLTGVVNNGGTGHRLKVDIYQLAGKTGTAKKNGCYDASFAGFFPAQEPRYTCIALIENCHAYGWQAGTVVREIADCVVAMDKDLNDALQKPKMATDSLKMSQTPVSEKGNQEEVARFFKLVKQPYRTQNPDSKWVYYQQATDTTQAIYQPYHPAEGRVPNCYGMTAKDAIALLHQLGYRARVVGYGKVASQTPCRGTTAKSGTLVVLNMK